MGTHRSFRGGGLLLALLAATSAAQDSRPASRPFVGAGALLAWSDVEPEAPQPHVLKAASAAEAWRPRAVRRGASRARAVARTDRARILVDVEAGAEGGLWLYDLDGAPPRRLWPDADAFVAAHGSVAVVAQAAADGGCSFSSIPLDDPAKARTLDLRLPGRGRLVAFDGLDPFDRRRSPLSAVAPSSFTALDGAAFAPTLPLPWEPPARTYRDLLPSSNGAFVACVTERDAAPGRYGGPAVVDLTLFSVDSGRRVAGFDLTPTYAPINPLSSHVRTYRAPYVRWLDADLVEFDRGFAPKSDNGMSEPLIERVRARLTADGAVVESATVAGDVEPPPPPERRFFGFEGDRLFVRAAPAVGVALGSGPDGQRIDARYPPRGRTAYSADGDLAAVVVPAAAGFELRVLDGFIPRAAIVGPCRKPSPTWLPPAP